MNVSVTYSRYNNENNKQLQCLRLWWSRFLDNLGTKGEEKVDKHRFLVQSKIIEDSEYNRFIALPANQRADEISKLWDGSKDDRRNVKLKVNFSYPEGAGRGTWQITTPVQPAKSVTRLLTTIFYFGD